MKIEDAQLDESKLGRSEMYLLVRGSDGDELLRTIDFDEFLRVWWFKIEPRPISIDLKDARWVVVMHCDGIYMKQL